MNRPVAGLIGGALVLASCGYRPSAAAPTLRPASSLTVINHFPAQDLLAARLTNLESLVTPFHLDSTSSGMTITLIGAYADPARTVLFFRGAGNYQVEFGAINDDFGFINAGGGGQQIKPSPGDSVYTVDGGPHPRADGVANLVIKVTDLQQYHVNSVTHLSGNWNWSIPLKVQPATTLPAAPQFALGRWKGNIEVLEVTPSVIHLRAVINGVSPANAFGPGIPEIITLLDPGGARLQASAGGAGITVPKQQVNPVNYQNTRFEFEWPRPTAGGTFQLRFLGGGGSYSIPVTIDALTD
jgi:hypothetical protein